MRSVPGKLLLAGFALLVAIPSCDKQEMADRAVKVWKAYYKVTLDSIRSNKELDHTAEMDKAAQAQGFKNWLDFLIEAEKILGGADWEKLCKEMAKVFQAEVEKVVKEMAERGQPDSAENPAQGEEGGEDPDAFGREAARSMIEDCPEFDESLTGAFHFGIYEGDRNVGRFRVQVSAAPDKTAAAYKVTTEMSVPAEGANLASEALLARDLSLGTIKRTYAEKGERLVFEARNEAGTWKMIYHRTPPNVAADSFYKEDVITFGLKIEDGEWRLFRMRERDGEWNDFEEIARMLKEHREHNPPDGD